MFSLLFIIIPIYVLISDRQRKMGLYSDDEHTQTQIFSFVLLAHRKSNINSHQETRGNHDLKYLSSINKRGQIVQDKTVQTIPMTLFYDADDKTFGKKEMIVKGRILDEYGQSQTDLGEAELNIAEYASEEIIQKFALEVQLQGSQKQICKIKFNVTIQRNLQKKDGFETTTQQVSEKDEKVSKRSIEKMKNKPKETSIQKSIKREEKSVQKSEISQKSQHKTDKCMFQSTLPKNDNKRQKFLQFNYENETSKALSPKMVDFQPPSEDTDTVILGRQTPPKLKNSESKPYSTELQLYQTQQLLKVRDKEISKLRKMLEDQQKINLVLVEQQRKQTSFKESFKLNRQITQLRTQLEVANMKISELESSNRGYFDQIERSQVAAEKMTKQISYYKGQLEREKLKAAELLQKAMEKGDNDLITLIEEAFAEY